MIDTELLVNQLRAYGHDVTHVITIPNNGGRYEFTVDGAVLSLEEARGLLADDENAGKTKKVL